MNKERLDKWAELLLDIGKGNNLINFKDGKSKTVEVILPDFKTLFDKADRSTNFEVFDIKFDDDEVLDKTEAETFVKEDYILRYQGKLKKGSQILLFNQKLNPIKALKNIQKTAKTAIEETGVNVAYMAFGFIKWAEEENSQTVYQAPIILMPVMIQNDSALEPYHVKTLGDEFILNPTFLYKLNTEYGIRLPEYDGEDIVEYLSSVQNLINPLKWEVSLDCKIGVFSFQKINMYRDLTDNSQDILVNNNVGKILGNAVNEPEPELIKYEFGEFKNVVDADSSQLEAIEMAKQGRSFVLQGPPGTGKSQTITNLIAECLADGKKVLFVSEKLAALNVVYDKLKSVGLEDFCLELHSHKANKQNFIDELCRTLRAPKSGVSGSAESHIEARKSSCRKLDEYTAELHKIYPVINKSLYGVYNEFATVSEVAPVEFAFTGIENKGDEYLYSAIELLNQYVAYTPSIGYAYKNNPWYGYKGQDLSYQGKIDLKEKLRSVLEITGDLVSVADSLKQYGLYPKSIGDIFTIKEVLKLVSESEFLTPNLISFIITKNSRAKEKIEKIKTIADKIFEIKVSIDKEYDKDIYNLNADDCYKKLVKLYGGFFSRLFSGEYKNIIKSLRLCKKDGEKISYYQAVSVFKKLSELNGLSFEFRGSVKDIRNKVGAGYDGENTDFDKLISECDLILKAVNEKFDLCKLCMLGADEYNKAKENFKNALLQISTLTEGKKDEVDFIINSFDKNAFDLSLVDLNTFKVKLFGCFERFDEVDNWCSFYHLLVKIEKAELKGFLDCLIRENCFIEDFVATFKKVFYGQWIDYILRQSEVLMSLSRVPHDKAVEIFKENDKLQLDINKAEIKAFLSSQRPDTDTVSAGSSVALLLRESEKKRRQKSIRALISEIGDLIQVLKPCFLMSPLSVSTFLQSNKIRFDTVIFDEASQIFPQDAIGAIYRGKQLIVVGDSKQMPPSNFFSATAEIADDDENADLTDFESILDLCSTVLPQKRLKWHYRSKYEELIAFSNKNFYSNELVTFPSASTIKKGVGVEFVLVQDGQFDHKSKTNKKEAERVVDLVFKNAMERPDKSLGVVAFSISQQDLIERVLNKRRRENGLHEEFFSSTRKEPFFIKNLETVQGDERDTIIFSVGYAKDEAGKLLHNFGPLNRAGGERRLNVAVTRAKENVVLVSSMVHTQIDLKKTSAKGALLLKEYLDYAENGAIALTRNLTVNEFDEYDSAFETEVCEFLRKKGYTVDTQVGCSSFKIDLAVRKGVGSNYALAIECDGATYHSSKTARDRDRLRQEILEKMGWKFYRIWSTDWFKNKSIEQERLLSAVRQALSGMCEEKTERRIEENFEEKIEISHYAFPDYIEANISLAKAMNSGNYLGAIKDILRKEAPMAEEYLLKRISSQFFDSSKVTERVLLEHKRLMAGAQNYGIEQRNGFLYLKNQTEYELRVPCLGKPREPKYIAIEELSQGMKKIIELNVSIEKENLYKSLASTLGFKRVGDAMRDRFEEVLNYIRKDINIDKERISLKG